MKYTLEMDITLPRAKGLFIAAAEKEKECETFSLTQHIIVYTITYRNEKANPQHDA